MSISKICTAVQSIRSSGDFGYIFCVVRWFLFSLYKDFVTSFTWFTSPFSCNGSPNLLLTNCWVISAVKWVLLSDWNFAGAPRLVNQRVNKWRTLPWNVFWSPWQRNASANFLKWFAMINRPVWSLSVAQISRWSVCNNLLKFPMKLLIKWLTSHPCDIFSIYKQDKNHSSWQLHAAIKPFVIVLNGPYTFFLFFVPCLLLILRLMCGWKILYIGNKYVILVGNPDLGTMSALKAFAAFDLCHGGHLSSRIFCHCCIGSWGSRRYWCSMSRDLGRSLNWWCSFIQWNSFAKYNNSWTANGVSKYFSWAYLEASVRILVFYTPPIKFCMASYLRISGKISGYHLLHSQFDPNILFFLARNKWVFHRASNLPESSRTAFL